MTTGPKYPATIEPGEGKKIVFLSWVPELATTRKLLLVQAGYEVTSILVEPGLRALDSIMNADLLILAHSVPRQLKLEALASFKRHCNAPILSLLRSYQKKLPDADYGVEAYSPAEFLDAVRNVTFPTRPPSS